MSIRVQTEFTRKSDVRCIYYHYDDDGDLATATEVLISIIDPKGAKVEDETGVDEGDTGVYEYLYATTITNAVGNYQIEVDARDSTKHSFYHHHFSLSAGINE